MQKVFGHPTFKIYIFALFNRIQMACTVRNIAQVKKKKKGIRVAQTEHGIMKWPPSMHCMSLWMKASSKCINVNVKKFKNNCLNGLKNRYIVQI